LGSKDVNFKNGAFTIGSISKKDDIQKPQQMTESSFDKTSINFTLTKRQFKKFVNQEG